MTPFRYVGLWNGINYLPSLLPVQHTQRWKLTEDHRFHQDQRISKNTNFVKFYILLLLLKRWVSSCLDTFDENWKTKGSEKNCVSQGTKITSSANRFFFQRHNLIQKIVSNLPIQNKSNERRKKKHVYLENP